MHDGNAHEEARVLRRVRWLLGLMIVGLVLSGVTAFPLVAEAELLQTMAGEGSWVASWWPSMGAWVSTVHRGLVETDARAPFLAYGTDWLAFAHIVIALAFIGPLRDPVKNVWVIEWGMLACVLVIPLAMICGPIRGIPLVWRLIDCSFGVLGIVPLWLARRNVLQLERLR